MSQSSVVMYRHYFDPFANIELELFRRRSYAHPKLRFRLLAMAFMIRSWITL
jgi:hypothetical protein